MTSYLEPELQQELVELVKRNDRTVAAEIRLAIRFWIDVQTAPTEGNAAVTTMNVYRRTDTTPTYRIEK